MHQEDTAALSKHTKHWLAAHSELKIHAEDERSGAYARQDGAARGRGEDSPVSASARWDTHITCLLVEYVSVVGLFHATVRGRCCDAPLIFTDQWQVINSDCVIVNYAQRTINCIHTGLTAAGLPYVSAVVVLPVGAYEVLRTAHVLLRRKPKEVLLTVLSAESSVGSSEEVQQDTWLLCLGAHLCMWK